eukprot:365554-Chlamydomonas_euryale.AAC.35
MPALRRRRRRGVFTRPSSQRGQRKLHRPLLAPALPTRRGRGVFTRPSSQRGPQRCHGCAIRRAKDARPLVLPGVRESNRHRALHRRAEDRRARAVSGRRRGCE